MGAEQSPHSFRQLINPDMQAKKDEDIQDYVNTDRILESYKTLSCSISQHHFGFQHRDNSEVLVCSPRCLSLALKKLRNSPRASVHSDEGSVESRRSLEKCIHGGNVNLDTFKNDAQYLLPPKSPPVIDLHNANGYYEEGVMHPHGDRSCCGSAESDIHVILEKAYEKKMKDDIAHKSVSQTSSSPEHSCYNDQSFGEPSAQTQTETEKEGHQYKLNQIETDSQTENDTSSDRAVDTKFQASKELSSEVNVSYRRTWTVNDVHLSPSLENLKTSFISYSWNSTKFTIQAEKDQDQISELQESIKQFCKKESGLSTIPAIDDIVFAPYGEIFYRAKVEEVRLQEEEVLVHFLDFGDTENTKISDCRVPCDQLMEAHPIYGVVFNSSLPDPVDWDSVSIDSKAEINSLLQAAMVGKVYMVPVETSGLEWAGVLMLEDFRHWNVILSNILNPKPELSDQTDHSIGSSETKCFLESIKTTATLPVPVVEELPSPQIQNVSQNEEVEEIGVKNVPNNVFIAEYSHTKLVKPPYITQMSTMKLSPSLQDGCLVHVNFVQNYKKMIISAQSDDDLLEELTNLIFQHVEEAPPMERTPSVMEAVLAPYKGNYYRGLVNTWKGKDKANRVNVAFIDFGDQATVKISDLKELTPAIASHVIYGVKLIVPNMSDNVASIKCAQLNEILETTSGSVELTKLQKLTGNGDLWFDGKKWSDLVESEFLSGNY